MEVKFKRFNEKAKIPEKAYDKDFCYDVYAISEEEVAPNVWKYGLGFGLQIERDLEPILEALDCIWDADGKNYISIDMKYCPLNLSIDFRPRSSIWRTGMLLSNCVGTIDEGYTNEISAVFYHVMPTMPRYRVGEKIGQIKIGMTFPITFKEVDELSETERGFRGYGSSGK